MPLFVRVREDTSVWESLQPSKGNNNNTYVLLFSAAYRKPRRGNTRWQHWRGLPYTILAIKNQNITSENGDEVFCFTMCFCAFPLLCASKKLPTNATTSQRFPLISILFCFSFCVFCCFTSFFLSFHSFIIHPNATLKFFLRYCVTFMLLLFSLLSLFLFSCRFDPIINLNFNTLTLDFNGSGCELEM